ncbi:MAG: DnaB-like helicase N-terminal domain-containing protein [Rhodococcus sp. (in: high G+C Gram-positive bacteria)]|uniref:DnaB-like helicase N-terminal domain-containing protein n=1 Tax=Rhodococcus sp. KRD197 TaxID=2729731 RepID=UPI0019D1538E|nr:DnaB-like helicase N-terminal domain-containing protein [Rhodococcus sp. KRD197]
MTPLRAVPTPGDDAGQAHADLAPVEHVLQVLADEVGYNPATDPEALLLCALMWSNNTGGVSTEDHRVATIVTADDFDNPAYRRMFTVIADLITASQPYDPASVTAALMRSGADGAKDSALRRRLNEVITTGADGLAVAHYAGIVLSQSYRRSFHTAGQAIMQGAEELPEEDLFEQMLDYGRRQRAAFNRLNAFRQPRP